MLVSWARAILSISKKAWAFPARPYYYKLSFPKINRKPNNSKTEGERDIPGPGQPRGEGLPCRLLSGPGGSGGDILGPRGSPMWGRAASRVPLVPRTTLSRTGCIPAAPNRKWFFGGKKKTTLRKVTSLALLNPYNSSTTLQFEAQSS